jgi:hypothetical protein
LFTVVAGYFVPPQPDEGTLAHLFQLSIVALVPMPLLSLSTAAWKGGLRVAKGLAFAFYFLSIANVQYQGRIVAQNS